jgi:hypothetical protein
MQDPVSGVFRVADWYDARPRSTSKDTRLTGVIVADGVPPTTAEVPIDNHGKWVNKSELPITVDRADPTNFRVEWDQVVKNDWASEARQRASEAAARMEAANRPDGGFGGQQATSFGQATDGQGMSVAGFSPMMDRALRQAGVDPSILHGANSNVEVHTSFGTVPPGTAQSMMAAFFGGQGGQGAVPGQNTAMPTTETTGVVTGVHDVPQPVPLPAGTSQADLSLDVRRPDGSTYGVTTRLGFRTPARRDAIAVVGKQLPVLVDQNDPGRVQIDVAKLNLP